MSAAVTAIRVNAHGGPETLVRESIPLPPPGPGEAQVRVQAAGVNFIDTYKRSGLYPVPPPFTPGEEGAGVVEALGEGVTGFAPGDAVVWLYSGSYAEALNVPAARLVKRPPGMDAAAAAALFLKGLTAGMLLNGIAQAQPGQSLLIHAAAGGMGSILTQWARHIGARVIGTAGSAEKAQAAKAHGADHVILYGEEDVAARVREITGGRGVDAVIDGVGAATFEASLDSLARRGWMISYGNASGVVPPFAPLELARRGSLRFTRPVLFDYIADEGDYRAAAQRLFAVVATGALKPALGARYALAGAAQAHRDLQGRRTQGSLVLVP